MGSDDTQRQTYGYRPEDLRPGDVIRLRLRAEVVTSVEVEGDLVMLSTDLGPLKPLVRGQDLPRSIVIARGPDAHYPTCGTCGDAWPCARERATAAAERILAEQHLLCTRCGKSTTGRKSVTVLVVTDRGHPAELHFHGRKGPCLEAARRLDPSLET